MLVGFKVYKKIDIYYRGEYQWSTNAFRTVREALIDAVVTYARAGASDQACGTIRAVRAER